MTARDIQRSLMADRSSRSTVMPNYTPRNWWECDVFELTKSGYFREYEIKLSRSDFKADAAKVKQGWQLLGDGWAQNPPTTKHQKLMDGDVCGPTHFWFVCPAGLLTVEDMPQWAGLLAAHPRQFPAPHNVRFEVVKVAPRLHKSKVDPVIRQRAESTGYYRFLNLFLHKPNLPVDTAALSEGAVASSGVKASKQC